MSKDFKITFEFHIDEDKAKEWFEDELKIMSKYYENYLDSGFLPEYINDYISRTVRKQNIDVDIYSGAFDKLYQEMYGYIEPVFTSVLIKNREVDYDQLQKVTNTWNNLAAKHRRGEHLTDTEVDEMLAAWDCKVELEKKGGLYHANR